VIRARSARVGKVRGKTLTQKSTAKKENSWWTFTVFPCFFRPPFLQLLFWAFSSAKVWRTWPAFDLVDRGLREGVFFAMHVQLFVAARKISAAFGPLALRFVKSGWQP